MAPASTPKEEGTFRMKSRGNRRATIRYRSAPATVGRVYSTDDREFQRAWIIDLSRTGVGMQLARPLRKGQQIALLMRSSDGVRAFELTAVVMHCHQLTGGDWHVGCEFTGPLSLEDLDQLL